ncbi:hypothetical protein PR048_009892 [Dryococelus australis]|uniref:Uncharacterized protein n=1 Tax=Dryococelus australis TaxID=614101 RepID=A0ABQ9I175_9NEOP|nr:hypothetical protein PR048_009892 [Dryococelus australis]
MPELSERQQKLLKKNLQYRTSEILASLRYSDCQWKKNKSRSTQCLLNFLEERSSLHKETKELFSEVGKVLRLILLTPVSFATPERRFYILKRLQNYLRSAMNQESMNHLAPRHTYQDRADYLAINEVCYEFVNNDCRVQVFGK